MSNEEFDPTVNKILFEEEYGVKEGWLRNIFNIPPNAIVKHRGEDWFVYNGEKGAFRLGYSSGLIFFRENPVTRALWRHKQECREGAVGKNSEPQYDLTIWFSSNGEIEHVNFQRMSMEVDYYGGIK